MDRERVRARACGQARYTIPDSLGLDERVVTCSRTVHPEWLYSALDISAFRPWLDECNGNLCAGILKRRTYILPDIPV
jgi:hypothetical protein